MAASGGPSRRGDSDETAKRVVEAAAAEFVEHGYDKAVISDIARRAGVTPGAVYPRWPHKSDLMAAAVDHIFEHLLPDQRIREMGLSELRPPEIITAWGTRLLTADSVRDVLVQVFGSARNNEVIRERLREFVDEEADQFNQIVDWAKEGGFCDTSHDTTALTLLIHAVGIGVHLLRSAGLADRHVPSEEAWFAVLEKVVGTMHPQTPLDQ